MDQKRIMPFHQFRLDGKNYLINIEKMTARAVDGALYKALEEMRDQPEAPLTPGTWAALESLSLLSDKPCGEPSGHGENAPVVSMALFLTQACNLRCVYCYEEKPGGCMEEKTAFQAVDWLMSKSGSASKIYISFFGGEPLINFPLMKKVAAYARERADMLQKTVSFNMTTNATLLNNEVIQFLKEQDVQVMVSMDGPREIQDRQRPFPDGRGSYDVVLPRVKKLLEAIPEARVHAVLTEDGEAARVKSALQEIGFSEVSLLPASAPLIGENSDGEAVRSRKAGELEGLIRELELEAQRWVRYTKNRDGAALKALKASSQLFPALIALSHQIKLRYACGAGVKYVAVSCSGDIYLCHRFAGMDAFRLGSVFEPELKRQDYHVSPLDRSPECAACFARHYCAGGCKHDNMGACGSAWTPPEEMCRLKKRELELAASVLGQMDATDRGFLAETSVIPPKPCPLDF